jgi:hypothetical protein
MIARAPDVQQHLFALDEHREFAVYTTMPDSAGFILVFMGGAWETAVSRHCARSLHGVSGGFDR